MPPPSPRLSRPSRTLRALALGHAAVVLAAPAWNEARPITAVAVLAAVGAAVLSASLVERPRFAVAGATLGGAGLALVGVTPLGAITVSEAIVLGVGVALVSPARDGVAAPVVAIGAGAAAVELAAVGLIFGRTGALRAAFVILLAVAVVAVVAVVDRRPAPPGGQGWAVTAVACVLAIGLLAWVAANDPTVEWFGHITTHGDRRGDEVAITFDDGPDAHWSLAVSRILDEHGVKGTFFEVGKAVDARPDITKALYDDGQLLANHSYRHDYTGWLDPRYPELGETQAAFERALGVCPALFRPPHGQRTPFMLAHVADRGMHTVTWDVSARDWVERDGHAVAKGILDEVRPGSIVLLHDGLDGKVEADRSVLEVALPEILDGLAAKGLHPVRLDELLGVDPYLDHC